MLIGYSRDSADDPNLDLQNDTLSTSGCQRSHNDNVSRTEANQPGLARALEDIRAGYPLAVKILAAAKRRHVVELYRSRKHTIKEICRLMGISKPTLYAYVLEFSDGP